MNYTTRLGSLVIEVPIESAATWPGWQFTDCGRYLRAPDGQHITQQRLEGLMWRDQMELRRAGYASRRRAEKAVRHGAKVKVVVVDLADWQQRHLGRLAG